MHELCTVVLLLAIHAAVPKVASPKPVTRGHVQSKHLKSKTRKHRRVAWVFFRSPLKGSRESLLRQNLKIDSENLERIADSEQLQSLVQENALVSLPETRYVGVSTKLPPDRRYCRPRTRIFLEEFGEDHYRRFGRGLTVTSAVRTVDFQKTLQRRNKNAAPESGELASPHLTGATVDIGKRGMSPQQLKWVRNYLLEMQSSGFIDVEEEFRQSVFHVTVYKDYELARVAPATVVPAAAGTAAPNPSRDALERAHDASGIPPL